MKKVGILSDTHYYMGEEIFRHLEGCDEIWHAGDIGSIEVADQLAKFKPLRAVFGNIDNHVVRNQHPLIQRFKCEKVDVLMKHIVGYPGKYDKSIFETIKNNPPSLLIAGHSHILKVQYDNANNFLFINPGAAGKNGFHTVRTIVRLTIDGEAMKDLEIIEMKR
jgi:putative phosphoesterase